jgi:hypothetical protein
VERAGLREQFVDPRVVWSLPTTSQV